MHYSRKSERDISILSDSFPLFTYIKSGFKNLAKVSSHAREQYWFQRLVCEQS